jgi:hypothetical protein
MLQLRRLGQGRTGSTPLTAVVWLRHLIVSRTVQRIPSFALLAHHLRVILVLSY